MIERIQSYPLIYRIEVPLPDNPLRYLNSYVIIGADRTLVIDTGFKRSECREALFSGLSELNIDLYKTDLFLTHLHGDHTGLVGDFVAAGSTIYMHGIDYQYLVDSADGSTWKFAEEKFMYEGMPLDDIKWQFSNQARKYSPKADFPVQRVEDGQTIHMAGEDFQIIHTPGHTKGLCCLWLPKYGIFFTSDHILFDITPNIQVWYHMKDSLAQYLKSLDKVRALPVQLALPGHRKGDTSIKGRIDAIKHHHDVRLRELYKATKAYPGSTAYDLAPHLTWSMRGKKWENFPPTQKWFAMGETLAHMEWLLHNGKVRKEEKNGHAVYWTV